MVPAAGIPDTGADGGHELGGGGDRHGLGGPQPGPHIRITPRRHRRGEPVSLPRSCCAAARAATAP